MTCHPTLALGTPHPPFRLTHNLISNDAVCTLWGLYLVRKTEMTPDLQPKNSRRQSEPPAQQVTWVTDCKHYEGDVNVGLENNGPNSKAGKMTKLREKLLWMWCDRLFAWSCYFPSPAIWSNIFHIAPSLLSLKSQHNNRHVDMLAISCPLTQWYQTFYDDNNGEIKDVQKCLSNFIITSISTIRSAEWHRQCSRLQTSLTDQL